MKGKNILITGASSGIGREVAKQISNKDTTVILVSRRREKLEIVRSELEGEGIVMPCDLTKNEDIAFVFETLKDMGIKLDGMVYCAGICFTKSVKVMEKDDLENMFRTNVFGFYEMCRNFQKAKVSNKGAAIVGVSSYAAVTKEMGMSAYAMTKGAMNIQVQVMAKEFLKRKIRVNTVMPAIVMSKMDTNHNIWKDEEIEWVNQKQPLGLIPIENVVRVIMFLLSEDAKYITGEALAISAGYHENLT